MGTTDRASLTHRAHAIGMPAASANPGTTPRAAHATIPPGSAAEAAWRQAIADDALLQAGVEAAEHLAVGRRRKVLVTRASLQAAIAWPISPACEAAAHEAFDGIEQGRPYRAVVAALRAAQEAARAARDAAWAQWRAEDTTVTTTCWTRPALRAIGPDNPLTVAVQAALLDAVEAGHCGESEMWAALNTLRAPMELITDCWARATSDWHTRSPRVPTVWVPLIRAVLQRAAPTGKGARALFGRWREGAVQLLARHEAHPLATDLIQSHIANMDVTIPLTEDELRTLPAMDTLSVPEVLAIVARIPVPAYTASAWTGIETLQLRILAQCLGHPSRTTVLWRTLWAAATTAPQQTAIFAAGGFRKLGPWWMDRVVATALCASISQIGLIGNAGRSHYGEPDVEVLLSLVQGHVEAAVWLGAWAACRPTYLAQALRTWRLEATHWPLRAEALVPYLNHDNPKVREAAQLAVGSCLPSGVRDPSHTPRTR